jgi:hypothetical protein
VPDVSSSFSQIFIFSPVSNFAKFGPVGAALIHADGRADGLDKVSAFRDRTNATKIITPNAVFYTRSILILLYVGVVTVKQTRV